MDGHSCYQSINLITTIHLDNVSNIVNCTSVNINFVCAYEFLIGSSRRLASSRSAAATLEAGACGEANKDAFF